jgi:hypothetical protein
MIALSKFTSAVSMRFLGRRILIQQQYGYNNKRVSGRTKHIANSTTAFPLSFRNSLLYF